MGRAASSEVGLPDLHTLAFPLGPTERERIEALIDHLVALLDQADGDPDLEPDCDGEPSIGQSSTLDDLAQHCVSILDGELDDADNEPSLGWSIVGSQGVGVEDMSPGMRRLYELGLLTDDTLSP